MISSKATFISRKKLSVLLLIMLLPAVLVAAPFRVAAISDDAHFSSLMDDMLSVLSGEITDPEAIARYEEKRLADEARGRDEELSRLRRQESFEAISQLSETENTSDSDGVLTLERVTPQFSDVEMEYLLQGNQEAFDYLMLREDLDLLLVADVHEDGLMTECTVYADGEEIHRNLYISSDDSAEFDSLLSALLPRLKDDEVVVRIEAPSAVSLTVDGETASLVRSVIVLERGEHVLRFTSPLYETVEMTIDAEEGLVVSPEFVPFPTSRLFVLTVPYDAEIYFQGLKQDGHFIPDADVPFQITAVKDGFSPLLVQSRLPLDRVNLSLRPAWMENENIVEKAKDRFYTNLLATIISFGCYVASDSLSAIYTDADIAPTVTLFAGVSFVQLVELFDSMFDYYQAARLGI